MLKIEPDIPARAKGPQAGPAVIEVTGLRKTYRLGRVDVPVLHGVDLTIRQGEWVAVLGASGSGKSTLLHLLGGLDRPDRSEPRPRIAFGDRVLSDLSSGALNRFRCRSIGFVFQFYHLLPELTVLENVLVGAMVRWGITGYLSQRAKAREGAKELLERFGLGHRLRHRPAELSGGERQRVAIARALVNDPAVLLADEPTGNLDRATGDKILNVLAGLRQTRNQTMVVATHDPEIAARADRVVHLQDGRVVEAG